MGPKSKGRCPYRTQKGERQTQNHVTREANIRAIWPQTKDTWKHSRLAEARKASLLQLQTVWSYETPISGFGLPELLQNFLYFKLLIL